jgi:hypothetical protein
MAVLHAPAETTVTQLPQSAKPARKRPARGPIPIPMIVLGLMVTFAVGYGAGSIQQFDQDWRSGVPVAVAVGHGQLDAASFAQAVAATLADSEYPVAGVVCGPVSEDPNSASLVAAAGSTAVSAKVEQTQMCRAGTTLGMVQIVAQTVGHDLTTTVFRAHG